MNGSGGKGLTQVMALGCFVKPQTFSSKFPFRRKKLLRMRNRCAVFLTMEKWMSSAQVVDCYNYGNMPLRSLFEKKHSVKCEGSWCSVPLGSITVFELKSCSPQAYPNREHYKLIYTNKFVNLHELDFQLNYPQ